MLFGDGTTSDNMLSGYQVLIFMGENVILTNWIVYG